MLKNSGDYGQDLWPITMGISSIVFDSPYDLWKPRKEVTLSKAQLEQKTGSYTAGKLKVDFAVKENHLYMILSNGSEFRLLAENEDFFYLENFNTSLHFIKSQNGVFEKMIIHEHGKDTELKKRD